MPDPTTALPPTFADVTRDGLARELDAQRERARRIEWPQRVAVDAVRETLDGAA